MDKTMYSSENGKLTARRTFDAQAGTVWRAWTEQELLDRWWAPEPWRSETRSMEFREGRSRLYAMVGPGGEKHWGRTDYESIQPGKEFSGKDVFCDENGTTDPSLPAAQFTIRFLEQKGRTEMIMITDYGSGEALQKILEMGMKEGLNLAFDQLDAVLERIGE